MGSGPPPAGPAAAADAGDGAALASLAIGRVRKRRDFLAANTGIRVPAQDFVLLVKPTATSESRVGFTVSRRIGNAVARNRARRRLREAVRASLAEGAIVSADHIFIARPQESERPFAALVGDVRMALAKAARRLQADQR